MCREEECPGSTARHSGALGDARAMVEGGSLALSAKAMALATVHLALAMAATVLAE